MSNQFLVKLHDHITQQIDEVNHQKSQAQSRGDELRSSFLKGKSSELKAIRKFLSKNFDLITQKYY